MIGGIWYGARRWDRPPRSSIRGSTSLLALGLAPLILVPSVAVMGGLMVLAGLAIAPATAIEYVLVDRIAPPGTSTEAFGWVITAAVLGSGLGAALAGSVVNGGDVRPRLRRSPSPAPGWPGSPRCWAGRRCALAAEPALSRAAAP